MKFKLFTSRQKPHTICSSHLLGLEVERPDGAIHSPFLLFYTIKEILIVFNAIFSGYIYRAGGSVNESKKEEKDQELIQSSTTPDLGYKWESDNFTIRHHKREPRDQQENTRH